MPLSDEDKQWLDARFSVEREWADSRFTIQKQEFRTELHSEIERVETRLLTEFHKWASPTAAGVRSHTALLRAVDLALEQLEGRVEDLEGKN